jgi:hypothetical protein
MVKTTTQVHRDAPAAQRPLGCRDRPSGHQPVQVEEGIDIVVGHVGPQDRAEDPGIMETLEVGIGMHSADERQ